MSETKSYSGLLGLDRLPRWVKITNYILTFMFMLVPTWALIFGSYLEYKYEALAIYCSGIVWLRLSGIHWRFIALFFFAIGIIIFLINVVLSFMYVWHMD